MSTCLTSFIKNLDVELREGSKKKGTLIGTDEIPSEMSANER